MSTIALDNRGGNAGLARADYDHVQCVRCGIWRKARPGVNICVDCKTVEHHAARIEPEPVVDRIPVRGPAGVVRFRPVPERLSAEDRAWCERAAEVGFWQQWERANRGGHNPLQAEAQRRARSYPQPFVDSGLHADSESVSNQHDRKKGARVDA